MTPESPTAQSGPSDFPIAQAEVMRLSTEAVRYTTFMETTRGFRAYTVAVALRSPMLTCCGMSKRELAREYASGFYASISKKELRAKLGLPA